MNRITLRCFIFFILLSSQHGFAQISYINPFIGTDGTGHTFPGPSRPFGMVQPGPDNRETGWDHTSGYQYRDSLIMGFSQTRANGTGINEFGDILLQPLTNNQTSDTRLTYDKSSEKASPGYYTVTLSNKVKVELSCTNRVAIHQYSYPSSDAYLLVDLQHGLRFMTDSLVLESDVQIRDKQTISGYCHIKNWVQRKYFFCIQFDQPISEQQLLERRKGENAPRYLLRFSLKQRTLKIKIALSTVSVDGAVKNLRTELPHWDLSRCVSDAQKAWTSYISRIQIDAPEKQKRIFYTSLYRLFLQPSNIADVDGQYRGPDDKIHTAPNKEYYSTLSLWDTYRAAHPLYTIIAPEKVNAFINSMIAHSEQAGFLPIWTAWGQDNYCMIGNHAIPVIADAYLKGFRGFNADKAMEQMLRTTREDHINSNWALLAKYGYYPFDSLDNEAVSRTLEHGVDDNSIAVMAKKMGKENIAAEYFKRAGRYKNLFDPQTRLFRGKNSRGEWRTPFEPLIATSPLNNPGDFTEANAWQYFWTPAQYNVSELADLLGGKKGFTQKLDSFFSLESVNANKYLGQEAMVGQYAHGNEPSHHIAYLYAYSEKPEKGRELISRICRDFYNDGPDGMIGNDDCGQMSAWYIFSTLGFYPVDPISGEFVFGITQVKKAVVRLPGNKELIIERSGAVNGADLQVTLNNKKLSRPFIRYNEVMAGGKLQFMSNTKDPVALRPFPLGSIEPRGWLKEQMKKDLLGFVGHLDQLVPALFADDIYGKNRLHGKSEIRDLGNLKEGDAAGNEQYQWWNSETQSNWWDGYIRHVFLLKDSAGMEKVHAYVKRILAGQDADGYLGIYSPDLRYKFNSENGELWSKTTLYRGLLAYYEFTGKKQVLDALVKAVDDVMRHYPAYHSSPFSSGKEFNGGVSHGLTFTDVLYRLYLYSGKKEYLDYALFLYKDYSGSWQSEKDAQEKNIKDRQYQLQSHGVHSYEHIRPLVVAAMADATDSSRELLSGYLEKISRHVTVTGGAIGDEWIAERAANETNTGYEYCSLQELMDSYLLLLQTTKEASYADKIENIFFNAAQGSRHPGTDGIAYLKTDNSLVMDGTRNGEQEEGRKQIRYKYSAAHQDVAVCCSPNAGRIAPYYIQNSWMQAEDTLVLALLLPGKLTTTINGSTVSLETITNYPYKNKLDLLIRADKPVRLKLLIRRPSWATGLRSNEKYKAEAYGIYYELSVSGEKTIYIQFETAPQINKTGSGEVYFKYGPLVYALPISAREEQGKIYAPGFTDKYYYPTDSTQYVYPGNTDLKYNKGRISTSLINSKTGQAAQVELIPLSETILRRVSFPVKR